MRTRPIPTLAAAGLLAMLALPCAAWASPAPLAANGIPVDPNRSVSGHFDAAGTQDWRLYLRRGRHYALRGETAAFQRVAVRAAGGGVVARFVMAYGDDLGDGTDFDAPYTGLYDVEVTQPAACFDQAPCVGPGALGGGYLLSAGRDCPGDASTRCSIAVGQTLHGLRASYGGDTDAYRTTLQAGRSYAVAVPTFPGQGDYLVEVRDARGARIAAALVEGPDEALTFAASAGGSYLVQVSPSDGAIGPYDLALSAR